MMQEKIAGALLGLACGDALGAPLEFQSPAQARARFGRLTEMVGGGLWAPGEWTDDTGMALCVAGGILANPADPVAEAGRRFLEWRRTAKDVGSTIGAALSAFSQQGDWVRAAQSTPQARSGKAGGNGSLMRTLPVALAYPDTVQRAAVSARLSGMTHWDPQAEVCCLVYNLWVGRLLTGESRRAAWGAALDDARQTAAQGRLAPDTPGPAPLPPEFWPRLHGIETKTYAELQPSGYAGYVVECLEAAVSCVLHAGGRRGGDHPGREPGGRGRHHRRRRGRRGGRPLGTERPAGPVAGRAAPAFRAWNTSPGRSPACAATTRSTRRRACRRSLSTGPRSASTRGATR